MTDTTAPAIITDLDDLVRYSHKVGLEEEPTVEARLAKFEAAHNITLAGDARELFEEYAVFFGGADPLGEELGILLGDEPTAE